MKRRNLLITSLITLVCAFILPLFSQAQEICDATNGYDTNDSYHDYNYANNSPYYSNNYDITDNYDTMEYHYNYRQVNGYQGFSKPIRFGRKFDNSANFSTGISSYQGTSTGPGPNGGYPGTPRGVYQTHYINTSIDPNSYMQPYSH